MSVWWQLAIGIVALWLVLRFALRLLTPREPSESLDDPMVGDPFAGVTAPKKKGPHNRSGAVALVEPDEDDENRSYPPRNFIKKLSRRFLSRLLLRYENGSL